MMVSEKLKKLYVDLTSLTIGFFSCMEMVICQNKYNQYKNKIILQLNKCLYPIKNHL